MRESQLQHEDEILVFRQQLSGAQRWSEKITHVQPISCKHVAIGKIVDYPWSLHLSTDGRQKADKRPADGWQTAHKTADKRPTRRPTKGWKAVDKRSTDGRQKADKRPADGWQTVHRRSTNGSQTASRWLTDGHLSVTKLLWTVVGCGLRCVCRSRFNGGKMFYERVW